MKKKKKYVIGISVIAVFLVVIGISYAYWSLTLSQTDKNNLATSCFNIEFSGVNDINLQNAYPITDSEGETLTPYTFTITNKCNNYASYQVNLEVLNTTTLNTNYIKTKFNNTISLLKDYEEVTKTLDNATTSYKLLTGNLDKNESVTYDLRLWMDYDTPASDDAMNKTFESKVTIVASYLDHIPTDYELCVKKYGSSSPQCKILADADTTGACPTVNDDGTVNVTSAESTNGYLCSAPDDYGTSYYYRGNVTNNYVKFGGYYWRILRVNGDGSIRMIYAGDANVIDALDETTKQTVLANGYNDSSTRYTQIGQSAFNPSDNKSSYVGYMYGNIDGTTIEETFANTNNSIMKTYLEDWYKTNILDRKLGSLIADSGFCNDRTIIEGDGISTQTYYGPFDRFRSNKSSLVCLNKKRDLFTTNAGAVGNKATKYPIGLITTDEIFLSGAYGSTANFSYYLYTGYEYWTMSPYDLRSYGAVYGFYLNSVGLPDYRWIANTISVRPTINLKAGSLNSGTGVWNDPYTII